MSVLESKGAQVSALAAWLAWIVDIAPKITVVVVMLYYFILLLRALADFINSDGIKALWAKLFGSKVVTPPDGKA